MSNVEQVDFQPGISFILLAKLPGLRLGAGSFSSPARQGYNTGVKFQDRSAEAVLYCKRSRPRRL